MKIRQLLFVLCLSILLGDDFTGFGSFINTTIPAGSAGMAGANSSWVNTGGAIMSNPAGIANLTGFSISTGVAGESMHASLLDDTQYSYLVAGYGFKKPLLRGTVLQHGFAVGYQGLEVKDVDEYEENENFISSFNYSEMAISTVYSVRFKSVLLGLKWIYFRQSTGTQGYSNNSGNDFSDNYLRPSEIGLQYHITRKIRMGTVLGRSVDVGEIDNTSAFARLGFSVVNINTILAFDMEYSEQTDMRLKFGLQHKFNNPLIARLGFSADIREGTGDWGTSEKIMVTLGAGYVVGQLVNSKSVVLDFALRQHIYPDFFSPLSRTIHFSISYQ